MEEQFRSVSFQFAEEFIICLQPVILSRGAWLESPEALKSFFVSVLGDRSVVQE